MTKSAFGQAVVLVAAGFCGVLTACRSPDTSTRAACLDEGLRDLAHSRWVEPRLSGGFAWQECQRSLPGDHVVEAARCPSSHFSSFPVSMTPESCDPLGRRHVEALRMLILRPERTEEAVEMLEALAADAPADAWILNDTAAAYLVRAQRLDRPSDLLKALETAQRGVEKSGSAESRFNLALTEETLGLSNLAVRSWEDYLSEDDGRGWVGEARERRGRLLGERARSAATWWPLNRQRLSEAVRARDRVAVGQLIGPFPDAAQRHVEEEVLRDWAQSETQETADKALATARLIAEELARTTGDHYLAETVGAILDASSPPRDVARLQALRKGHLAFAKARLAERAQQWAQEETYYRQARQFFATANSPLREGADLGIAIVLFRRAGKAQLARVLTLLESIEKEARKRGYHHLIGRTLWIRALCLTFTNRPLQALQGYNAALLSFARMADRENLANVRARKTGILRALGENELAWREIFQALPGLPRMVELQSEHQLLGEAAASALALGHPRSALLFQDRAVRLFEDELRSPAGPIEKVRELRFNLALSLRERAAIRLHAEQVGPARADLEQAIRLAQMPSDESIRLALRARIREVEAGTLLASNPRAAIQAFQDALALSTSGTFPSFRAQVLFELSQAYRGLGRRPEAERHLVLGLRELEKEEKALLAGSSRGEGEALWSAYFSRFQGAYRLLIGLLAEDKRPAEAFSYAEKARGLEPLSLVRQSPLAPAAFRKLAGSGEPLALEKIQAQLPRGTFLIEYCVLDDRTLIWVIWRNGLELLERRVGRQILEKWAAEVQAKARHRDVEGFDTALSQPFHDLVGTPLAWLANAARSEGGVERLVFIPDGAIHGLPLAALRDPETRRYLIEDYPVSIAPSASLYIYSLLRDRDLPRRGAPTALLMGDPAFDPASDLTRELPRLDRAAAEVEKIRRFYPNAVVLTGGNATPDRFIALSAESTVVHFAGHAVANPQSPYRSRLLFSPSAGRSGALSAEEMLSELQLRKTRLFVLSACSSAGGHPIGPEGLAALVRPLMASGVPAVVGSLWNVGDDTTEELLVELHRHYTAGEDAANALRQAQLSLLRRESPGLRSALSWAPFQVIGYASSPSAPNRHH